MCSWCRENKGSTTSIRSSHIVGFSTAHFGRLATYLLPLVPFICYLADDRPSCHLGHLGVGPVKLCDVCFPLSLTPANDRVAGPNADWVPHTQMPQKNQWLFVRIKISALTKTYNTIVVREQQAGQISYLADRRIVWLGGVYRHRLRLVPYRE